MESIERNEDPNEHTQHKEKNQLTNFEHNDVVFFKHKERGRLGIGRVVNFYTELKVNDIHLSPNHNIILANYTKILNNLNDENYVQSYIANLSSENVDNNHPQEATNPNTSEKINCEPYEKEQKQDNKYTNLEGKNEEKEIQDNTKTGINNNNANNPQFKCEMKKRRRRKGIHTMDTALMNSNSISNCVIRKNDEKRKSSEIFYIIQSLENYRYILQYKKDFKYFKIFTHKKWELVKTHFCKNIQNKMSFVLAMKLLEVKKVYEHNVNLQNVMINKLMKIYESERDLHVDHLVLNFIKKVDVRIILQNNVLITNDEFNEITSSSKKENDEDNRLEMFHSNELNSLLDEENATTQGEMTHLWGFHKESCGRGKMGSDYDEEMNTPHQGSHLDDQQKDMNHTSNVNYFCKSSIDCETKEHLNFGKKHPPQNAMKYLVGCGTDQTTDSSPCSDDQEGPCKMHQNDNINLQHYGRGRRVIEGETYQYELKGNLLAKFKSPQGIAYRGCIKNICKGKNTILSYFLIVPSFFWFNDSYYFSCLNIDMDIFQLLEIIKIVDKSKKKQIESIPFAKYEGLRKNYESMYKTKPNGVHSLLRKGATDNTSANVRMPAAKKAITKKRKRRRRRTVNVENGQTINKERSVDKTSRNCVTKEKIRKKIKKRKKEQKENLDGKADRGLKIKKRKKVMQTEVTYEKCKGKKKTVIPIQEKSNREEEAKEVKGVRKVEEVEMKKEIEKGALHENEKEMRHKNEKEMHHKSEKEMHHKSEKEMHHKSEKEMHHKSEKEVHHKSEKEVHHKSEKEMRHKSEKEVRNENEEEMHRKKKEQLPNEKETKVQNKETETNCLLKTPHNLTGDKAIKLTQDSSTKRTIFNINKERTKTYLTKLALFFKFSKEREQKLKEDDEEDKKETEPQTVECEAAHENGYMEDNKKVTHDKSNTNENDQSINVIAKVNEEKEEVNFRKEDPEHKDPNENVNQGYANVNEGKGEPDAQVQDQDNTLISKLNAKGKEVDEHNVVDPPFLGKGNTDEMHKHINYQQEESVDENVIIISDDTDYLNDDDGNTSCIIIEEGIVRDNHKPMEGIVEPLYEKMSQMDITNEEEIFKNENFADLNEDNYVKPTNYKNDILGDKTDSLNGDNRSYQNESTISQYSYEKKGTSNDYNGRDQNGSTISQNSYEKNEGINCDNAYDRNEFTASQNSYEKNEGINCDNAYDRNEFTARQNSYEKDEGINCDNAYDRNEFTARQNSYEKDEGINCDNAYDRNEFTASQNSYEKIEQTIGAVTSEVNRPGYDTRMSFSSEQMNGTIISNANHVGSRSNTYLKKMININNLVKKESHQNENYNLTVQVDFSNKKDTSRMCSTTQTDYNNLCKNKCAEHTNKSLDDEKIKKIEQLYKFCKEDINILLYVYVMHIYVNKLCKNVIVKVLNPKFKRRKRKRRTLQKKNNLLSDTYVKPKMSNPSSEVISKMKNIEDKTCGKAENVIKYNTNFVNFYLWGIYNWNYNKTLRVSFNNISNKKISNFDIYNFFFYNYDTISNLNEINKDLSTLINIYKNVRNVLYRNSSIYGNLFLLKPTKTIARTHSDDEQLIEFWLKTLNELHKIREGFCKFF
ncbi:Uncharacterized protein PKNOH_S05399200 [Plasmodium knowlesi]|uniref:Uncharacterized protein n=1 Tax=Plasmodium knowlesi TaxID=5850 RepID=A0A1Y3DSQ1_PLAKN|nr:Uncharacterized protein PKNOH_S05399200 [Plasmodium knowlesi]